LLVVVVGLLFNWTDGTDLTHMPSYYFRRLFFWVCKIWTSSIALYIGLFK
jgi:hypothetical protein